MVPTFRERLVSKWITLQVKLGLLRYGRQKDGEVGGCTVPLGFASQGTVRAKILKSSTGEWKDFGVIASKKPFILKRLLYAYRVKKANKWLKS